jgi:hypothetical protein
MDILSFLGLSGGAKAGFMPRLTVVRKYFHQALKRSDPVPIFFTE